MARNIVTTLLVIFFASIAWGQEIHHAPTAEQCKADIAVWRAESREAIVALPVHSLVDRANFLFDCKNVLQEIHDPDEALWARTIRLTYEDHISTRALNFLNRRHPAMGQQFLDEDANGAR